MASVRLAFSDLVGDIRRDLSQRFLDPPSRCSLALTNRDNFSFFSDSILFGSSFLCEIVKYGHLTLMRLLLEDWKIPCAFLEILSFAEKCPSFQSTQTLIYLLDCVETYNLNKLESNFESEDVDEGFAKLFSSWVAQLDVESFSSLPSSPFWVKLISNPDTYFIQNLISNLIGGGCFEFLKSAVEKDGPEPSAWQKTLKHSELLPLAFPNSSIEHIKWYYEYLYLKDSFGADSIEEKIFYELFNCGLVGSKSKEQIHFIISYFRRNADSYINPNSVMEIVKNLSQKGNIEILGIIFQNKDIFDLQGSNLIQGVHSVAEGALKEFSLPSIKFLLSLIESDLNIPDNIIDLFKYNFHERNFGRSDLVDRSQEIARCAIYVLDHYPASFRDSILNYDPNNKMINISNFISLGDIKLIEKIKSYNLEIDPRCIEVFYSSLFGKRLHLPNRSIPVIEHLLKTFPRVILPNKEIILAFMNKMELSDAICRPEALKYLRHIEEISGVDVFRLCSEDTISISVYFSSKERIIRKIKIGEFLEGFKYVLDRVSDSLDWAPILQREVAVVPSKFIRNKYVEFFQIIKH